MEDNIFRELGFSDGEVKVYFALLELQDATIGEINKRALVTPSKTYTILDKLIAKGVVSSSMVGRVKHFQVLNPKRLLNILDEKNKKIEMQKKEVLKMLPRLEAKKKIKKQYSTVYEGYMGMKTLYDEIIDYCRETGDEFIGFAMDEKDYMDESLMYFFKKYDRVRNELKIKTKLISPVWIENLCKYNTDFIEIRFIDFKLPTGLIIWGDNVAYLSWSDKPCAFVISSENVARSNRDFFYEIWNRAKKK